MNAGVSVVALDEVQTLLHDLNQGNITRLQAEDRVLAIIAEEVQRHQAAPAQPAATAKASALDSAETFEGVVDEIIGELDHRNIGRQSAVRQIVEAAEQARAELAGAPVGEGGGPAEPAEYIGHVLVMLRGGLRQEREVLADLVAYVERREELLRGQYAEQYAGNLYDTFASMVQVATGFDGVIPEPLARTLMVGIEPPPASDALARLSWFAEAEGRLRYLKADMMMKAREI